MSVCHSGVSAPMNDINSNATTTRANPTTGKIL